MSAGGPQPTVAIVGGSIAGLTTAILLGQLDIEVRVFERQAPGGEPRGAGVGIDLDLLAAVTGYIDTAPPYIRLRERRVVVEGRTQAERVEIPVTAHHLLRAFLHER
ncbi:MAG: NAD(P)-binding protein, partial [Myxococcales bacterium]|nr:NAD(P)-binding protein [Myxococcales bacterium]